MLAIKILSAFAAVISAGCWTRAALIVTPLPMAYLSGPATGVRDRLQEQSRWNAIAAWAAAVLVICQAITIWF
jgi:hypothetical protein